LCPRRTQALIAGTAVVVCVATLFGLLAAGRALAQVSFQPLLPLAPGKLTVLLGTPPQWLPESGTPTGLTLFSGRPAVRNASAVTAYVALQSDRQRCASTPAGDRRPLLDIPMFYASNNLIAKHRSSPFAGAQRGDYAVTLPSIVVHQTGRTRVCVWLARDVRSRGLVLSQSIRLLNGLFAASVSALASATPGIGGGYTLNAIDVGTPFTYAVTTLQCGVHSLDTSGTVKDGQLATESIGPETNPCAGDGSTVAFAVGDRALASLAYTVTQAIAVPPQVSTVGGCELDPVADISLIEAEQYVQAVGCTVGRLLLAPYNAGLPKGAVIEAQVDGGLAEVAPPRTAVDLELNGRPALSVYTKR
jgi:hypothetical protein